MLSTALRHPNPYSAIRRKQTAHCAVPNIRLVCSFTTNKPRHGFALRSPTFATPSEGIAPATGVSELVKSLNNEIKACKTVEELEYHFSANSTEYDAVCVATMWMTLASLRGKVNATGRQEAPMGFIRHKLLGKTLAVVHLMEARAVSNVLWAMGKLNVDLAREANGPYFASMVEERVRQLVEGGGLRDGRGAAQLWYGLALSGCTWSGQLLGLMVERTVEAFGTWQLQAQGEVLFHMSQSSPALSEEQRRQLARHVEEIVRTWSLHQQQTYRSAPSLAQGICILRLPAAPQCVATLHSVMLCTPRDVQASIGARVLAYGLARLVRLGCPVSREQGSRWEGMLLEAWRAGVARRTGDWYADLGQVVSALKAIPDFVPSEELRQQLVQVAARAGAGGMDQKTARIVVEAAEAWGVALPPEAVQRLSQRQGARGEGRGPAAGGRRPQGASGGRGPAAGAKGGRQRQQ